MFDGNFRDGVDRIVGPIGRLLVRIGISADFLTCIGLLMSVAACVFIGRGQLRLGGLGWPGACPVHEGARELDQVRWPSEGM